MKKMKLIIVILFLCASSYAQQNTLEGIVLDEASLPIPGATIVVKGTTKGEFTDFEGKFSIIIPKDSEIIEVSSLGYLKQEINVKGKTKITIKMKEDLSELDEVVIIGYGTQKKINLTGSVETVKGEEITKQPVLQTSQALAGLVPGLTVTQDSGQPGQDGGTLRIRGIGTLGADSKNDPLILIDGIQGDLNGVDGNDIESISVLKDASAAAIYGSRAANGVILVTTKRGKEGKISVSYNTYLGVQDITEMINIADGLTYIETRNLISPGFYSDQLVADYTANRGSDEYPDNDWVDLLFSQTGYQQYHNFSVNGGSDKVKAAASLSYQDQQGNAPNFNFERISGRFNTDFKISEKLSVAFDLNLIRSKRTEPATGLGNLFEGGVYRTQPVLAAINSDGTWGGAFAGRNPIARAVDGGTTNVADNYFRAVLRAVYKPIDGLSLAFTYAPEVTDQDYKSFSRTFAFSDFTDPKLGSRVSGVENRRVGNASLDQRNVSTLQESMNFIVTYDKSFSDHNIGGTFGYEFLKFNFDRFSAKRVGFELEEFPELDNGDPEQQFNGGNSTLNGLESVFGRINYNYKGKYLVEGNLRRDASSRFALENRVSYFPSVSLGWNISKESFFPKSQNLNSFKIRASWGELGNQNTGTSNFPYTASIGLAASQPIIGGSPLLAGAQTTLANRAIQWETTETTNLAIDASFFKNRLSLTAEIYKRKTKDILLGVTIPTSTGLNPPIQNAGDVENTGWDLAIGWKDTVGKLKYGFNFNISDYENKITNLNGLDELPSSGDQINRLGESIGALYGLNVVGFYEEADFNPDGTLRDGVTTSFSRVRPGDYKYEDITGDGAVSNDDRQILGSPLARLNYGFDLFAEYKGFDFSASFLGVGKRDVQIKRFIGYPVINESAWATLQEWQTRDYWTPDNTNARYSRYEGGLNAANNMRLNSRYVYNGAYLRLRNLTIGYSLSSKAAEKIGIGGLRLYVSGQNLFTIENLPEGFDPTIPDNTQGNFYPITSVYTVGINLNF